MKCLAAHCPTCSLLAILAIGIGKIESAPAALPENASAEHITQIIADDTRPIDDRLEAVTRAGESRLSACIPALIAAIDKIRDRYIVEEIPPLHVLFPCVEALVQIGIPSINPVVEALGLPQTPLRRNLLREVLFRLEGDEGTRKYKEAIRFAREIVPVAKPDAKSAESRTAGSMVTKSGVKAAVPSATDPSTSATPGKAHSQTHAATIRTDPMTSTLWPVWILIAGSAMGLLWLLLKSRAAAKPSGGSR